MNPLRSIFLFALAALAPLAAQAADYCVHNDSEFAGALIGARFAPPPNRIELVRGTTYHTNNTLLVDASGAYAVTDLTIAGGYIGDCSATPVTDARTTVIDGTGTDVRIAPADSFALRNLSVIGTQLFKLFPEDQSSMRVSHVRFVDYGNFEINSLANDDPTILIDNSLFAGGIGVTIWGCTQNGNDNGQAVTLVNTTITGSSSGGMLVHCPAQVALYDSILYANAGYDLKYEQDFGVGGQVFGAYNNIGTLAAGTGYNPVSMGNLSSDPQFVSPASGNYNLQLSSPAYNSGTSNVPGGLSAYDIEGGTRVVGTKVDRGAYENDSSGTTIINVTSAADAVGTCPSSSNCTLRQAILDANTNPSFNIIGFNIAGSCPRTITLTSALPAITDAVRISGYTQPGSSQNTSDLTDNAVPCVELVDGAGITNGLRFAAAANDDSFEVSGLAIGGFGTGIFLDNTLINSYNDFDIWGNFIGLAADGTTARANTTFGIDVRGRSYGSVGGPNPEQRNVIVGALAGVRLAGDDGPFSYSSVVNNFIGTGKSGNTARPNGVGVAVLSEHNLIEDNLISGNNGAGISLSASTAQYNVMKGNRIGVKAFCLPPCSSGNDLANGGSGVNISSSASYNTVSSNTIAYNGGDGISVTSGNYNNLFANALYGNTGLGIDLGADGVNPNDNDSASSATANEGRNYPVLGVAFGDYRHGTVTGSLSSVNSAFSLDFYASDSCDGSGNGEGRYRIGSTTATIVNATPGNDGQVNFILALTDAPVDLPGKAITATATRRGTTATSTSEFSQCVTYEFRDVIFADGFEVP